MARRRSLRLSTRVTLFFGAMALIGGIGLTFATFLFARNSLLDQRISSAKVTAIQHATDMNDLLDTSPDASTVAQAVQDLDTEQGGYAALLTDPEFSHCFIGNGDIEFMHFSLPYSYLTSSPFTTILLRRCAQHI